MTIHNFLQYQRTLAGVWLKDWRRYRDALDSPREEYLALCNRGERLDAAPDGSGYRCNWRWTSDLHAPKFIPKLGAQLMKRALDDHPIRRVAGLSAEGAAPEVTFVIGHRGTERLAQLLATLESIAGQQGAAVDCVVVEQDSTARIAAHLPPWVRYVHTPPPDPEMPYCRSWTFNVGASHGAASVLVLHDNDMLVPADYASSILARVAQGYEVVNLKRFIFYLSEDHTRSVLANHDTLTRFAPQAVVQNLEAGGSIAVTRQAFDNIGGMDESFIGWGGEDNEFWDRAQCLRVWPYGALPIVHLWHPAQPGKQQAGNRTLDHFRTLSAIPIADRIERLRATPRGKASSPVDPHCARTIP